MLLGYNLESNIGSFQGLQCARGTVTTQVVAILKELTLKSFFKNKKGYDWLIDAKEQNTIGNIYNMSDRKKHHPYLQDVY